MDFDNYYVGKILIPKISNRDQHPVIALVDQILTTKQKSPDADTSELERQIGRMVKPMSSYWRGNGNLRE